MSIDPVIGIGRYEGTDMFLGRREQTRESSAIIAHVVIEPQSVFGAAMLVLHPHTEIKPGHIAK